MTERNGDICIYISNCLLLLEELGSKFFNERNKKERKKREKLQSSIVSSNSNSYSNCKFVIKF